MNIRAFTTCQILFVVLLSTPIQAQQSSSANECFNFSTNTCLVKMTWAGLTMWADNWSNKDYSAYINSYASQAAPQAGVSREQWLVKRERALSGAAKIKISLNLIDVQYKADSSARATVIQRYTAPHYSDIVLKTFHLVLEQGQAKILTENVDRTLEPTEADAIINEFGY